MACVSEAGADVTVQELDSRFDGDCVVDEQILSLSELAFGVLNSIVELDPASAGFGAGDLCA